MEKNNSRKKVILSRNMKINPQQPNKENEKEKEKFYNSQRISDNNLTHFHSKSLIQTNIDINKEKPNTKKLSFNNIEEDDEDDEELDHPKPLMSDYEDNFEDLKNQFIYKIENKKNLQNSFPNKENQDLNLNLKNIPQINDIPKINNSHNEEYFLLIDNNKDNNQQKDTNNSNNKNYDKTIRQKKVLNTDIISKGDNNQNKAQINNNNMNYKKSNTDIIANNNFIANGDKIRVKEDILINKVNNQVNNNQKKTNEEISFYNLKDKKYRAIPKGFKNNINNIIRNENYNYMNRPINNKINKNQYYKNNSYTKYQKQKVNSVYIPNTKVKYENGIQNKIVKEVYERNNSQKNNNQNLHNKSFNLSLKDLNNINSENIKPINIKKINNLIYNEERQDSKLERIYEDDTLLNNKNIIKNELNNGLNIVKIKSSEIKKPDFPKRDNVFINRLDNPNNMKYRKRSFERGGIFNNVQTTFVVISKNQKSKGIPRRNIIPDYNNKTINPAPSAKCLNYEKLCIEEEIPQPLETPRMNINEPIIFRMNKGIPINNYNNDLILDDNNTNYDINYKNYIESLNKGNRSRDIYNERNIYNLINKSNNINDNTFPIYDYDYNNNDYYSNNNYDSNRICIRKYSFNSNNPNYYY